jgi:hypothetical protein
MKIRDLHKKLTSHSMFSINCMIKLNQFYVCKQKYFLGSRKVVMNPKLVL